MRDLATLQKEIHENAVAKGWWETDRSWPEARILIVSEIAEMLEEFRAGRMGVWHDGNADLPYVPGVEFEKEVREGAPPSERKPEGFPIEGADVGIRILDWCGRWGHRVSAGESDLPGHVPEQLDYLTGELYGYEVDRDACQSALDVLFSIADRHGFDLVECMELKHAYNKTRPYRHGGKAA